MPEEIDALLLQTQFDEAGLDQSAQAQLNSLRRFHSTVEELSRRSAASQVADLQRFASEANDVLQLRQFDTGESVRELQELESAFPPLIAAIRQFDPTGILQRTAVQAQGAAIAMRELAEAQQLAVDAQRQAEGISVDVIVPEIPEGTIRLLAGQLQSLAEVEVAAGSGARDMAQGLRLAGQAAAESAAQSARWAQAMQQVRAQQEAQAAASIQGANQANALATSLARVAQETRVLASLPPPSFNSQPAVNAAQTLVTQLGLTARSVQTVRDALSQPVQLRVLRSEELQVLAGRLQSLRTLQVENADAARRMALGFEAAGQAARRAGAGTEAWARGMAELRRQQQGADAALAGTARGADRVRNGLVALTASLTGVPPAIASIVSGLLLVGAGSAVVLGIAAGAAVIAAAWSLVTRSAREARQATEDFIRAQVQAARARDPFGEMIRQLDGVPGEIQGVTDRLRELRAELEATRRAQAASPIGDLGFAGFRGQIAQIERAIRDAETAQQEVARGFAERVFQEVEALSRATLQAQRQAIDADLALQRQGFSRREQVLRSAFDAEAITAREFYRQRIRLAQEAGAAEIRALQAQRAALSQQLPARSPEEAVAQQARLDAIRDAIELRQRETAIQLEQIQNEARLAETAQALVPIQRELADLLQQRAAQATLGPAAITFDTTVARAQLAELEAQLLRLADEASTESQRRIVLDAVVQLRAARLETLRDDLQRELGALEFGITLTTDIDGIARAVRERLGIPIPVSLDTQAAVRQAEALRDEIGRRIAAAGGEAQAAPIDVQAFRQLTETIQRALDAPFQALLQGATRAREALEASRAAIEAQRALSAGAFDTGAGVADTARGLAQIGPLVQAIEARFREVTAAIDSGAASQERQIALLREQAALAEELRTIQAARAQILPADIIPSFAPLQAATRAFVAARERLQAAQAVGAGQAARAAAQEAESARAQMEFSRDQIVRLVGDLGLSGEEARRVFVELARAMGQLEDPTDALSREVQEIVRGLTQIGAAARRIGLIGDEAAQAIADVERLGEAVLSVVQSASAGNILGLIGSGLNVLGGLLGGGPSPAEQALRENTEAIRRNTIAQTQGFEGLGGATAVANAIQQVLATQAGREAAASTEDFGFIGREARAQLVAMLEEFGISFEQLQRVAEEFGIEILANGKLVGGALAQLDEAIRESVQAQLRWRQTMDDAITAIELRQRLTGDFDPAAAFERQLEAARGLGAGDLIDRFFGGIDLGDAEAVQRAGLALLDAFEQGKLAAEELGALTREDLIRIIKGAADHLDALGESARHAAAEMSNIPSGFRQASLAFEAQIPGFGPTAPVIQLPAAITPRGEGAELPILKVLEEVKTLARSRGNQITVHIAGDRLTPRQLWELVKQGATEAGEAGDVDAFTRRA